MSRLDLPTLGPQALEDLVMVNDWNKALDEAVAVCIARERDALSRTRKSPQWVAMDLAEAKEARDCAEAIAKLKTKGAKAS